MEGASIGAGLPVSRGPTAERRPRPPRPGRGFSVYGARRFQFFV